MVILYSFLLSSALILAPPESADTSIQDGLGTEIEYDDSAYDNFDIIGGDIIDENLQDYEELQEDNLENNEDIEEVVVSDESSDSDTDNNTVSGNNISIDISELVDSINKLSDEQLAVSNAVYSSYDAYGGTISTSILEFFRGYLSDLSYSDNYVLSRVGQYDYIFAYGSLNYSSGVFSGSVRIVKYNTYNNGTVTLSSDNNFRLNYTSGMLYTSLRDSGFPQLSTSSDFSLRQLVFCCAFIILGWTFNQFRVSKKRR